MSEQTREVKKILLAGPVGVGKSTAVQASSDSPALTTEARPTDVTAEQKPSTTVAMDFGVLTLEDGVVVHLYGTPGQRRFNFMWDILSGGSCGVIVLVDAGKPRAMAELEEYLEAYQPLVTQGRVVVGVTRLKPAQVNGLAPYRETLARLPIRLPVFEADPRRRRDVEVLIRALLATSRQAAA